MFVLCLDNPDAFFVIRIIFGIIRRSNNTVRLQIMTAANFRYVEENVRSDKSIACASSVSMKNYGKRVTLRH